MACKAKESISEHISSTKEQITDTASEYIENVKDVVGDKTGNVMSKITDIKKQSTDRINQVVDSVINHPIRTSRPDLTLLGEVILVIICFFALTFLWPYLSAKINKYSSHQLNQAKKLPQSAFSIADMAKIEMQGKSLQKYYNYFRSNPFSDEHIGIGELQRMNTYLPFIAFIIQYLVPPMVAGYLIWFVIKYWKYVLDAIWGWFLMMYHFATGRVECVLAEKWYIRWITGWSDDCPTFGEMFDDWRRTYIDIPIYKEKLKYVREFNEAKEKYYTRPKQKYIDAPLESLTQRFENMRARLSSLKQKYFDNVINSITSKSSELTSLPKEELYKRIVTDNKHLANIYSQVKKTTNKIQGDSYTSTTKSGKQCKCPARKTHMSKLTDSVSTHINRAKDDVSNLVSSTHAVFDKFGGLKDGLDPTNCENIDSLISNRRMYALIVLGAVVLSIGGVMAYSYIWGTPLVMIRLMGSIQQHKMVGSNLVSVGKRYPMMPIYVILGLFGILISIIVL